MGRIIRLVRLVGPEAFCVDNPGQSLQLLPFGMCVVELVALPQFPPSNVTGSTFPLVNLPA